MSELHPLAYCFYKTFAPETRKAMCFDRYYLLYAAHGALRLEAEDRHWILPPTRAAWIPANTQIHIEIPHKVICCSVLLHPEFFSSQISDCQVINLNLLTREMILHTRRWGPETEKLSPHAKSFFKTLAGTCAELANQPSKIWVPKGKTKELQIALTFTKAHIADNISIQDVANAACLSQRSLSRRFAMETGMTWRQLQRRMRMIFAMELLSNTDEKIIQVAFDVGYVSLSAFNRAFHDFSGITPGGFRSKYFENAPITMD